MALPTAPLGQLPSMNMPYAIPTYERGPSIWEKALGAFLVGAAGNVAGTLADNVLTRDEASSFGEKDATGFSRLLGPNVTKEEALQRRSQTFQAGEAEKGRAFDADQLEQRLLAAAGQSDADAANARLLQGDRTQAGLDEQYLQDKNAGLRQDRDIAAGLELDARRGQRTDAAAAAEVAAQRELEELRAMLRARDPGNIAQAERDRAAAEESRGRVDFNRQFFGGQGAGTAQPQPQASSTPAVDPSIAAFARARTTTPTLDAKTNDAAMREFMSYMPNADGTPVAPATEPLFRLPSGEMVPRDQIPDDDPNGVLSILRQLLSRTSENRISPGVGNTR